MNRNIYCGSAELRRQQSKRCETRCVHKRTVALVLVCMAAVNGCAPVRVPCGRDIDTIRIAAMYYSTRWQRGLAPEEVLDPEAVRSDLQMRISDVAFTNSFCQKLQALQRIDGSGAIGAYLVCEIAYHDDGMDTLAFGRGDIVLNGRPCAFDEDFLLMIAEQLPPSHRSDIEEYLDQR